MDRLGKIFRHECTRVTPKAHTTAKPAHLHTNVLQVTMHSRSNPFRHEKVSVSIQ
jgi:hypothetical protein